MSTTLTLPAWDRPGLEHEPGLSRRERHRGGGAHCRSLYRTGETVDTRRNVHRDHRSAPRAELIGEPCRVAFERAAEARAVHRVDRDVGARERAGEPAAIDTRCELDHVHPHTPAFQRGRGDQTVTAVVAFPAHHDRPTPVTPSGGTAHLPCDRASGTLHQHGDRRTGRDRALIGTSH